MGIIIRQSLQNTAISYLGVALGFVITIWMYPNILTAEQYGLTRVLLSLGVVFSQLANLGMNNTIIRFFPYFKDKKQNHHGFFFLALAVPLAGFLLFGVLAVIFQDLVTRYFIERSELLVEYYGFLLPLAFCILYFQVLNSFVRALYDTVTASFLNDVFIRILTALLLVVYLLGWITFKGFMIVFVINYAVILLMLFAYTLLQQQAVLRPDFDFLSGSLVKKMTDYGVFAFWGGVASIIVGNVDIIMLSALAGLEETGIYAIAFYVGSAITIIRQSIYKISAPIIANAFKNEDYGLIEDLYKRSSLNQFIGGGLLFCGIVANIDNLMSLLPETYGGGAMVIVVIGSANLFDMATGLNGAIILNSRLYRFDLYTTLGLVIVTVTLNYLLIPEYGILGAAIGTASAIILYNLVKVILVRIEFNMQPFDWKMLPVLIVGGLTLLAGFQLAKVGTTYTDLLIRSAAITIGYLAPILAFRLSPDLNKLLRNLLQKP